MIPKAQTQLANIWLPMDTAPKDGTEILVRDKNGNLSLVAWSDATESDEESFWHYVDNDPGWYRRAEGSWDLFDSFAPQAIDDPNCWFAIPPRHQ